MPVGNFKNSPEECHTALTSALHNNDSAEALAIGTLLLYYHQHVLTTEEENNVRKVCFQMAWKIAATIGDPQPVITDYYPPIPNLMKATDPVPPQEPKDIINDTRPIITDYYPPVPTHEATDPTLKKPSNEEAEYVTKLLQLTNHLPEPPLERTINKVNYDLLSRQIKTFSDELPWENDIYQDNFRGILSVTPQKKYYLHQLTYCNRRSGRIVIMLAVNNRDGQPEHAHQVDHYRLIMRGATSIITVNTNDPFKAFEIHDYVIEKLTECGDALSAINDLAFLSPYSTQKDATGRDLVVLAG